jgi:hypothetical protein
VGTSSSFIVITRTVAGAGRSYRFGDPMSHDKIKAAARERMARTGEPYATARRQVLDEIRAAAAAHEELGPEYSDAVVASFLDRVEEEITARVEARLAAVPSRPETPRRPEMPRRPAVPVGADQRRTLLRGIAIGIAISIVAIIGVGGNSSERVHRLALVMLALAVMVAGAWAFSAVRAWRRLAELGPASGQSREDRGR